MCGVELRSARLRDEPVLSNRYALDHRTAAVLLGGPFVKIDRPGKRCQQHELGERQIRLSGECDRRLERDLGIAWQSEDKGPENMNAMVPKRAQPGYEFVAGEVEALVHVLQTFSGHGLDADQRAKNPRALHGLEKLGILRGFHGDLREKHQIAR